MTTMRSTMLGNGAGRLPIALAVCAAQGVLGQSAMPATGTSAPEETVSHLYAYAAEFERKLPSLSCHESIRVDDVKHGEVERTVPEEAVKSRKETPFAAMDYGPVALGADSLWLPVRMESHDPKQEHRLEVRYSGCQRYTGSMKIVDGVQPVPEP